MDAFGWIAVAKIIVGVAVGSTVGTFISIHVAKRIIQGSAADWLAEATEGETEASNIVKRLQDWAENDFAHAVGEAVAKELEEKRKEGE